LWLVLVFAVVVLGAGTGVGLAMAIRHKAPPSAALVPRAPSTTAAATGPPCPLTGVAAAGGSVPQRPALAVKVDNYPAARPQSGLDKADIVFEEPVEGGITRLVAVFQCQQASSVGDIRSARAVDVQILDELSDPLFVHAGGIPPVLSLLAQGNLIDENVFTHASIVTLDPDRVAPYSTYTSTAQAWGLDPSDTTPPSPIFTYSNSIPAGTSVDSLHIPYSGTNDNTWVWNSSAKQWQLEFSGQPALLSDGEQISATNVVVQSVQVTYGPWVESGCCTLEVQSQLTGSGPLLVLRDGEEITGTWKRSSLTDPTSLMTSDGTTIPLAPGNTWVEIVPDSITVSAG
jgi:hypothetical protein